MIRSAGSPVSQQKVHICLNAHFNMSRLVTLGHYEKLRSFRDMVNLNIFHNKVKGTEDFLVSRPARIYVGFRGGNRIHQIWFVCCK